MSKKRPKKNKPITSKEEQQKIYAKAFDEQEVPDHMSLEEFDRPYFEAIISELPNTDWTAHKLQLAVILAKNCADLDYNQMLLRREGTLVTRDEKKPKSKNPRVDVVKSLENQILAMRRSMGLHSTAVNGEIKDYDKRKKAAVEAQKKAKESGTVLDLIPRKA